MKKFLALTIAALIGLTTVLTVTPVQADSSVQPQAQTAELSAQGGQLGDGCRNVSISYYFSDDDWPLSRWELNIDVFTPGGSLSDTDTFFGTGSIASGTMDALICKFEGVGTYRVEATIDWSDEDENLLSTNSASTTFLMTKPPAPAVPKARTTTTMTISDTTPRPRQIVTIKATSSVKTKTSWKRNRNAYVALEKRTPRGWVRWLGTKQTTNAHGKATWQTRAPKRTIRLRAVTLVTSDHLASHSEAKRIK